MKIVGFGNPVYDLISTPKFKTRERVLSGCSTNACLALAKLGIQVTIVGTIGEDYLIRLENDLDKFRIDRAIFKAKQTGGFSLAYVDDQGNRELRVLGVADPLPSNIALNLYKNADFILLGPILGEITVEMVKELRVNSASPIFLDPQGLLRRQRNGSVDHILTEEFIEIAKLSDVIKANELETFVVTGIEGRADPEKAVEKLFEFGGKIAILTLAEAGSIIYDGDHFLRIPAFKTNAVDPTGAGDTYAAGFMLKYLECSQDLESAGYFASAVASIMVEHVGPDFPLSRVEVDSRVKMMLAEHSNEYLTNQ
jgi:sugar/nucleoside kinase (ribokinase family)